MDMVMTVSDAVERVADFQPVRVPSGDVGIAVEFRGEEIRVAFLDGRVLWFHLAYVRAEVNV